MAPEPSMRSELFRPIPSYSELFRVKIFGRVPPHCILHSSFCILHSAGLRPLTSALPSLTAAIRCIPLYSAVIRCKKIFLAPTSDRESRELPPTVSCPPPLRHALRLTHHTSPMSPNVANVGFHENDLGNRHYLHATSVLICANLRKSALICAVF